MTGMGSRVLAALLLCLAAPASATEVAVTIDDLPVAANGATLKEERAITARLLAGLVRHRIVATGFVNEGKTAGPDHEERVALLTRWLDAGMDLANHGYSHLSFTTTPLAAYQADIARGEPETKRLLAERGRTLRYFRHPFLHTGPTAQARGEFERWLAKRGYTVAPVTLDNADWLFATVYDDAVAHGDAAGAARIAAAYLAHSDAMFGWQLAAARGLLGRDIRHVLLLHANRLNADHIDELAALLEKHELVDVPLARALADPVYARRDSYAGPDGIGWTHRWAKDMRRELPWATQPKVPADVQAVYDRLTAKP